MIKINISPKKIYQWLKSTSSTLLVIREMTKAIPTVLSIIKNTKVMEGGV
jgi:hypothetical protein